MLVTTSGLCIVPLMGPVWPVNILHGLLLGSHGYVITCQSRQVWDSIVSCRYNHGYPCWGTWPDAAVYRLGVRRTSLYVFIMVATHINKAVVRDLVWPLTQNSMRNSWRYSWLITGLADSSLSKKKISNLFVHTAQKIPQILFNHTSYKKEIFHRLEIILIVGCATYYNYKKDLVITLSSYNFRWCVKYPEMWIVSSVIPQSLVHCQLNNWF